MAFKMVFPFSISAWMDTQDEKSERLKGIVVLNFSVNSVWDLSLIKN